MISRWKKSTIKRSGKIRKQVSKLLLHEVRLTYGKKYMTNFFTSIMNLFSVVNAFNLQYYAHFRHFILDCVSP